MRQLPLFCDPFCGFFCRPVFYVLTVAVVHEYNLLAVSPLQLCC